MELGNVTTAPVDSNNDYEFVSEQIEQENRIVCISGIWKRETNFDPDYQLWEELEQRENERGKCRAFTGHAAAQPTQNRSPPHRQKNLLAV